MLTPYARICTILVLSLTSAAALAQDASADQIIQSGLRALKDIDEGRTGEVWEAAAPVIKARFPKTELAGALSRSRQTVGTVAQRTWASVNRIRYNEGTSTPAGLYANIDYSTRLTDGRVVFELVSFRQEADGSWRFTGYVPRQTQ